MTLWPGGQRRIIRTFGVFVVKASVASEVGQSTCIEPNRFFVSVMEKWVTLVE